MKRSINSIIIFNLYSIQIKTLKNATLWHIDQ